MIVEKISKNDVLKQIKMYIKCFDNNDRCEVFNSEFEKMIKLLKTQVEPEAIFIECVESEIESLLLEYIYMLSSKKHISTLVFVNKKNSIEVLGKLDKVKYWSESYKALPTKTLDNKVVIYITFFNSDYSQKYDVALAAKLFL